jgi:Protein kinase domain
VAKSGWRVAEKPPPSCWGADVESAADEDPGALVAEYGALREEQPSQERTRGLGELVVRLLRECGAEAAVRDGDPLLVAFRYEGRPFVMGIAWEGHKAQAGVLAEAVRESAAGAQAVLLSMSGFAGQVARAGPGTAVLWDRSHLEAAVCGLVTLPGLLEASSRVLFFNGSAYETLARLLVIPDDGVPAGMGAPDLLPPPWPVLGAEYDGIPAQLVLGGDDGWDKPSGIAALDNDRLVVATAGGLVELDCIRGGTSWLMRLPGCVNEPLVLPDGSVLAGCGKAVIRVTDDRLEAVAGGFDGNVHLLAGPGGDPWVLSGHGASFGPGDGSLALTRISTKVGDQHRYDIYFPAKVNAAGWLGGLRFFLAANGHSAVVDLGRSTRVGRDRWIESPQGYEQQLVVTSPDSVATAAGEPAGIGVTLFHTDVSTGTSARFAKFELNAVDGLCATPDGTGYLLGDMHAGRPYSREPWPVLLRLPGLRSPATAPATAQLAVAEASPAKASPMLRADTDRPQCPQDQVRAAARGLRGDYALDPAPIGRGGQAEVFRARHKPSGVIVAIKRLHPATPDGIARMRREIDAAQAFGGSPHIVPVLDFSNQREWFVMPLARHNATAMLPGLSDTTALRALVTATCQALGPAHEAGWVHRDLKPENLLWLDATWAVADWGLTRRPRGQTTDPHRTQTEAAFGSEGWAAPELSADAHKAGPPADIYSIGQIIGWAITGQRPQANTPLIPPSGPWRQVVRAATQRDPARRPGSADALLTTIEQELDYELPDPADTAGQLLAAASDGDATAAAQLFALAARRPDDVRLYTQVLPAMPCDAVSAAVDADRQQADEVVQAALGHIHDHDLGWDDADRIVTWLHWIAVRASEINDLGLLEQATGAALTWDASWDQWTPQKLIRRWLAGLRNDQAAAAARALREHGNIRHFSELADDRHTDERIRRAVRPA